MKPHFVMFAAYNAWANRRLFDAAGELPETEYRAARGVFFGSMHGTLNHLLAADRIWMRRFTGKGEAPNRLDAILIEDRGDLRRARESEDERIAAYVGALSQDDLAGVIRYRTITTPRDIEQPLADALAHFFNHQTHHRGQAHAIITGLRRQAPSFDMILFHREGPQLGGTS
jgi:uncharacterized damage-inducible protein DinB